MSLSPWHIGMRVRLVKPDNAAHPRKGDVGEVVEFKEYPADPEYPKRGRPVRTLLWVRYRKASWADWVEKRLIDETYGHFDHEIEPVA
jgi:hypothetical protein